MPRTLLALLCLGALPLLSQCSDAGVCTLGHGPSPLPNQVSLLGQVGRSGSPDDLQFQALKVQGRFQLRAGTALTVVLPFGTIRGPLGSTSGLGDALLVLEQTLGEGAWGRVSGQLGARLATGRDDADGLPQRYQLGLGSTDPMVGLRLDAGDWEAGLGYQRASRRSGNALEPLQRGDDLLVHGGLRGQLGTLPAGLQVMAIQRLGTSDLLRADGTRQSLPDSRRLQVNLVGSLAYPLAGGWSLEGRLALPLLQRPDNTDGLKRAWTFEAGVSWRF